VDRYQQSKPPRTPDAEFFWKISKQRGDKQVLPVQGIYVVTPSGKLLAFRQRDHDPVSIAKLLSQALDQWNALSPNERLGTEPLSGIEAASRRPDSRPPEGGLVLELFVRDLPRKTAPVDTKFAAMWNRDFAWFSAEEVRSMIPETRTPGERHRVSDKVVRRLARLHLLDSVRGINDARPFEDKHVEKAEMFMNVIKVEGDVLFLRIEGATRAVEPPLVDAGGSGRPDEKERGYEARLSGRATVDVRQSKFVAFSLLAIGPRWGGRGYAHSKRQDDLEPQPMGVAFRMLPPSEPVESAVPHHVANYFTRCR
jgi:hypothetical protein